jgi:ribosomal protein L16 Arg81 hydroxylase
MKKHIRRHIRKKLKTVKEREDELPPVEWKQEDHVTESEALSFINEKLFSKQLDLKDFICNHYEASVPLLLRSNSSKRFSFLLDDVNELAQFISDKKKMLYARKDVRFTKIDEKDDALLDATPEESVSVTMQMVQNYIEEGCAVHFQNLDLFSQKIANCLRMIDIWWKGQGGSFVSVSFCPKGVAAYPPYSEPNDTFLLQVQGRQKVILYRPFKSEKNTFPYFHHGSNPITVFEIEEVDTTGDCEREVFLEPGDLLYKPAGYIAYCEADSNSLSMSIALPNHISLLEYMNLMLSKTMSKLGIKSRILPHAPIPDTNKPADIFGYNLKTNVSLVLNECLNNQEEILEKLKWRCTYGRIHFNVYNWIMQYDLISMLNKNGGLVKLSNFLPQEVANRIYRTLESLNDDEWVLAEATDDQKQNNIAHAFMISRLFPNHDPIFNIFRQLLPNCENSFSAGRYTKSHYISPHDDRQFTEIDGNIYSRTIALIYYLTPDWKKENGGALVDIGGDQTYIPEYNSLIAFKVPRWHEVEPCVTDKPRYSIFGWYLQLGQLYELNTGSYE